MHGWTHCLFYAGQKKSSTKSLTFATWRRFCQAISFEDEIVNHSILPELLIADVSEFSRRIQFVCEIHSRSVVRPEAILARPDVQKLDTKI